jgi:hypothetical protein
MTRLQWWDLAYAICWISCGWCGLLSSPKRVLWGSCLWYYAGVPVLSCYNPVWLVFGGVGAIRVCDLWAGDDVINTLCGGYECWINF